MPETYEQKLQEMLPKNRFKHSKDTMETAVKLAKIHGVDVDKARLAGLLHDAARGLTIQQMYDLADEYGVTIPEGYRQNPKTLHAFVAPLVLNKYFGIEDDEIFSAVSKHTTASKEMNDLDKVIFVADYIEPGRKTPGISDVRHLALRDLDKAALLALDRTIFYLEENGHYINPESLEAQKALRKQVEMRKYD